MCYYNGIKVTRGELIMLLQMEASVKDYEALYKPIHDGFKYEDFPIVKPVNGGKEIIVEEAHWELIPDMIRSRDDLKEFRKKYTTLDAKGETLLTSRWYKDSALKRRCLIPSSGFYEWRHYKPFGGSKDVAYPYHISVANSNYFYIAGIWKPWTDKVTGETFDTFTMVTTAANSLMELVHNKKKRMPTMLTDELAHEWIQDGLSEERITQLATYQIEAESLTAHTIRKDFKALEDPCEHFEYSELPALGQDGEAPGTISLFG